METFLLVAIVVVALAYFFFFRRGAPGEAERERELPGADAGRRDAPAARERTSGAPGAAAAQRAATSGAAVPPASLDENDVQLEDAQAASVRAVPEGHRERSESIHVSACPDGCKATNP